MTSPSVDLDGILPYGVTVEGTGNRNAEIVTESNFRNSNVALTLPDGPCRVAASWDGSEAVRLVHSGHGYPVVLPAGGGYRSGTATVGATAGETIFLQNVSSSPLRTGGRGTIEVYPLPQL